MLNSSTTFLVWSNIWRLGGMAVWLGMCFIVPVDNSQIYMYYGPQERKNLIFYKFMKVQLEVHLHCMCCLQSWGGGLWLHILSAGTVNGAEIRMGILLPASLQSPSGRTNVCGPSIQGHCVPRAHTVGAPQKITVNVHIMEVFCKWLGKRGRFSILLRQNTLC